MANTHKPTTEHRPAHVAPVRLEVNRRGGWGYVIGFDRADASAAQAVQRAALTLCGVGGGVWRICTDDAMPQPLLYLHDAGRGWEPAREAI